VRGGAGQRLDAAAGGFEDGLAGHGAPLHVVRKRGYMSPSPAAITPNFSALPQFCAFTPVGWLKTPERRKRSPRLRGCNLIATVVGWATIGGCGLRHLGVKIGVYNLLENGKEAPTGMAGNRHRLYPGKARLCEIPLRFPLLGCFSTLEIPCWAPWEMGQTDV